MSLEFITDIPIDLGIKLFHLPLNYTKISDEILSKQSVRLSDSSVNSLFEDTQFLFDVGSESESFLKKITKFFEEENLKIKDIWTHIHQPLESTNTHNHGPFPRNFSFVFYVKTPVNSGKLVFSLESQPIKSIFPIEGNLIIFPSWLPHFVTKNLSDDTRISISGNLVPIK